MNNRNNLELPENRPIQIPNQLPFLEDICWQINDVYQLTTYEMLQHYEQGWRYRDTFQSMTEAEKEFIKCLSIQYDSWLDTEIMTFKNPYHRNILEVLGSLDSDLLESNFAYFGGGTVIALDNQEYRFRSFSDQL